MSYRQLLGKGHFWKLWTSQILSLIAQNLLNYTLVIRVAELTRGTSFSNISVALVIMAFGVPSILFAAFAGVFVDSWSRKKVLWISNIIRALLLLAYLQSENQLWLVLILTFLVSTATQFFAPAESAAIPALVDKPNLLRANALFVSTFYFAFVIGYVAAAPLLHYFGSHASYAFAASMFAVAGILATLLPSLRVETSSAPPLRRSVATIWQQMAENARLIRSRHELYFPILQLMFVQAIISVLLAFAPALSLALLKAPLQDASHYVVLPAALGMIAGIGLVGRLSRRIPKLILIKLGILMAGISLLGLGLAGQLYRTGWHLPLSVGAVSAIVAVLVLCIGFANAVVSVAGQTVLQEHTADEARGRVFGALNMMINISLTIPVLFAAIAADLLSVTKVLSIVGCLIVLLALGQFLHKFEVESN